MSPRHRAEDFRRFLNLIVNTVPVHLEVHLTATPPYQELPSDH
jgi:hypothetical protein